MIKKQFSISMLILLSHFTLTQAEAQFQFQEGLLKSRKMSLPDIKKQISDHARKRLTKHWIFTSRYVHNATISAINCYEQLPQTPENIAAMQQILTSHGNYLYSILHWNERKHALLVDGFMNDVADKRLPTTLLDLPTGSPALAIGAGVGMNSTNGQSK